MQSLVDYPSTFCFGTGRSRASHPSGKPILVGRICSPLVHVCNCVQPRKVSKWILVILAIHRFHVRQPQIGRWLLHGCRPLAEKHARLYASSGPRRCGQSIVHAFLHHGALFGHPRFEAAATPKMCRNHTDGDGDNHEAAATTKVLR